MNTRASIGRIFAGLAVAGTLVIGAVIYSSSAEANVTDGPDGKWSELPERDRREAGGVGAGGPILPPGTGGFGDVPPEPTDATEPPVDCNPDDDGAIELGELTCAPSEWGGNCTGRCLAYGAACFPGVENQITQRQNLLWKCCNCNPGKCWYIDRTDPKSGCVSPAGASTSLLCW